MQDLILNNGQKAKFIGEDDWSRPLFKLENGIVVCCVEFDGSSLHTICGGEPNCPLKEEYQAVNAGDEEYALKHEYMLLDRYRSDVEYFLGNGGRNEKHLFFGDAKKHITEMVKLWKKLPKKPKWLTAVQLVKYKAQILLS